MRSNSSIGEAFSLLKGKEGFFHALSALE